jgi:hypothetical protein
VTRPTVPAGFKAYVAMDGVKWSVRLTPGNKRISPSFVHQVNAYAYLDWIEGGPEFRYPEGEA